MTHLHFPTRRCLRFTILAVACLPLSAAAQHEPVAVVAVAGLDRLLDDVDYVFSAAGQPQHAQLIRGVITNLNDLRGLDRHRPAGLYLHFPIAGQKDPQPLFFFPVSNLDELLTSIRIGNALRLERGESSDRLTLHTEDGEIPVKLEHGYAFLDPTKSAARFQQPLANPEQLLQGVLGNHDVVLLVRRAGIPPFLFEAVRGQLQGEAAKTERQRTGETDAEYHIRRDASQSILSLANSVLTDWRSTTIGVNLSAENQAFEMDAVVALADEGEAARFLDQIAASGTMFSPQLAAISAVSLATHWQATPPGRDLLGQVMAILRQQTAPHLANADVETRSAVDGVLEALEATAVRGQFDAYVQLNARPPSGFVLLGGIALAEAEKVATGLEQLLPFAAGSKDIRSIDMDVARADEVAIHRLVPMSLRRRDERLYGKEAAIYMAAGQGAFWLSVGDEGALDQLIEAITASEGNRVGFLVDARPHSHESTARTTTPIPAANTSLFALTMHASDWVGFASTSGGGKNARLAELARTAFADPEQDCFRLSLAPGKDGLRLHVTLDEGYIRLFGLALAERLQQN